LTPLRLGGEKPASRNELPESLAQSGYNHPNILFCSHLRGKKQNTKKENFLIRFTF
jgi:hypothetical protein